MRWHQLFTYGAIGRPGVILRKGADFANAVLNMDQAGGPFGTPDRFDQLYRDALDEARAATKALGLAPRAFSGTPEAVLDGLEFLSEQDGKIRWPPADHGDA